MPEKYIVSNKLDSGENLPPQSLGKTFYEELKKRNPNDVTLIQEDKEITYNKLLNTSIQMAWTLKNLGIQKGDIISIISPNRWDYLALTISSFYVGATTLLLNNSYTSGEYEHIFSICTPKLIFCLSQNLPNILQAKEETMNVVLLDDEASGSFQNLQDLLLLETKSTFEPVDVDINQDLAVIITSSGTTGLPKAVMLTHANVIASLSVVGDENFIKFNQNVRTIDYLPFFHIMGMCWALSGILFRTKAVILSKFKPDIFLSAIHNLKVTTLFAVPPVLVFLVKNSNVDKYNISSLTDIFVSGAVLKKEIEEAIKTCFSHVNFYQVYGMTEVSGPITCTIKNNAKKGSVGRPVRIIEDIIVVNDNEEVMGPFENGEIRLKGTGVMKGYYKNEKETKQAFDKNGYLRTGDLGYFDDENDFFIVGRCKEIIKYKGFQVAPAELEGLLIRHEAIADAGVIGIPDEKAGELPLAFVVRAPNQTITEKDILHYVEDNVSFQKRLHGGVRFIDEIPKNASGKILRKKLMQLL